MLLINQANKNNTLNKFNSIRSTAKSCESIFEMFPDLLEQQQQKNLEQDQQQQQQQLEQDILETKNKIVTKSSQIESVKTPTLSDLFSQVAVLKSPKVYFKIVYSASKIR